MWAEAPEMTGGQTSFYLIALSGSARAYYPSPARPTNARDARLHRDFRALNLERVSGFTLIFLLQAQFGGKIVRRCREPGNYSPAARSE